MKERYPGTMGRTQGEMKDTSPATKAAARETEEVMKGTFRTWERPDHYRHLTRLDAVVYWS
jgi:hypothetical protein